MSFEQRVLELGFFSPHTSSHADLAQFVASPLKRRSSDREHWGTESAPCLFAGSPLTPQGPLPRTLIHTNEPSSSASTSQEEEGAHSISSTQPLRKQVRLEAELAQKRGNERHQQSVEADSPGQLTLSPQPDTEEEDVVPDELPTVLQSTCTSLASSCSPRPLVSPSSPMSLSRCRLRKQCLSSPAFDLSVVQRTQSQSLLEDSVCNAAECDPISEINEVLCLGTWRDAANAELLERHRIKYVLNVAKELAPKEVVVMAPHIIGACIPMEDCQHQDLEHGLDTAFRFIEDARRQQGRVLIHCRRGISRSAAIVIAYLMAADGSSFDDAFHVVKQRRPCVCLNLAFQQKLSEYVPDPQWRWPIAAMASPDEHEEDSPENRVCCRKLTLHNTNPSSSSFLIACMEDDSTEAVDLSDEVVASPLLKQSRDRPGFISVCFEDPQYLGTTESSPCLSV